MLKYEKLTVTTTALGAGSATSKAVRGYLVAVDYQDGSFDDGIDFTLDVINSEGAYNLLTATNANDDLTYHPRGDSCTTAGTVTTGAADVFLPIIGQLKFTVASGGDTKTGAVLVFYEE